VAEDHASIERGFNLHAPVVEPGAREAHISFNIFEPGPARLTVRDSVGEVVATLREGPEEDLGVQTLRWRPGSPPDGTLYVVMEYGRDVQVRRFRLGPGARP
jgi:hypothetical protein